MNSRPFLRPTTAAAVATLVAGLGGPLSAQANRGRDFDAEIDEAIGVAKRAAGTEHLGTLSRICLLPASGGENTSDNVPRYVLDPSAAPPRESWYADPARIFDNFYFVGGSEHSSWAITTSEGIIIIDTIYPYNSDELIVGGLRRLGLDPADIRYVIISHAHGDHIGGAQMLQERYDARVVMGAADWESVERYPNRFRTMAPRRDIVATDGMRITLGDATVTVWETPGHTPGTLSYTFTVLENGRPVNVAYSGGTAFNFVNNTPNPGIQNFQTYIDSQRHMAEEAARTGATVILSNHSEFDAATTKNRLLAGWRALQLMGVPAGTHPYIVGEDSVQRYFQVMQGCARAAQLGLERQLVL